MIYAAFMGALIIGFVAGILVGRKNRNKIEQAMRKADRLKRKMDDMK